MNACATCRFMAAERFNEPHRTCTRIIHGNSGDYSRRELRRRPAFVVDGSGYAARLMVLPTFGCVLHEEQRS